ncbi:MAG TPA: hypothetical protein VNQ90_05140 [Chthoniobacteraceae bacterium]|nr:hypothetical protein [Chthoniobacteraceae bacterium]
MIHWNALLATAALLILNVAASGETAMPWPGAETQKELGLPAAAPRAWEPVWSEKAADKATRLEAISGLHVGGERLLLRLAFHGTPDFSNERLIVNFDLDQQADTGEKVNSRAGTDLYLTLRDQQWSARFFPPLCTEENSKVRALQEGDVVYVMIDTPVIAATGGLKIHARLSRPGEPDQYVSAAPYLPMPVEAVPPVLEELRFRFIAPFSSFRFISPTAGPIDPSVSMSGRKKGLALEKLSNKGLDGAAVRGDAEDPFGRPRPRPLFRSGPATADESKEAAGRVEVAVREEAGVARTRGEVSFGFPLPAGTLYDPGHVSVEENGRSIPATVQTTVLWPDGSIRWVLIAFHDRFEPRENKVYTVAYGEKPAQPETPPLLREERERFVVETGRLHAVVSKQRGSLLEEIAIDGVPTGITLPEGVFFEDEHGQRYSTRQARLLRAGVEEHGRDKVTLRLEGEYATSKGEGKLRFVSRLTFYRGGARVLLTHTHLNTHLENEFFDLRRLSLPLEMPRAAATVSTLAGNAETPADAKRIDAQGSLLFRQETEDRSTLRTEKETITSKRSSGVFAIEGERLRFSGGIVDSWQRWPKGFSVEGKELRIDLLPPYEKAFEETLPPHLRYPFCEGFYRMKWGMSFTERVWLDFSGETSLSELAGAVQKPLVAVLPAGWYVQTRAFGDIAVGSDERHRQWDAFFEKSFRAHLARREAQREYGFLNYGDWFGERARNWGNNEYDTAHAFFSQFCRTGETDYFRAALAAARHQADVDLVHAYPDPATVGAQVIHGVGHTGSSSHRVDYGTWSNPMRLSAVATNGHTWAEGLIEAWYLTGDAPVMEAALTLGEHIAWVAAPRFRMAAHAPRYGGWALRAIMAIQQATLDPLYLEAATKLARESTREQHPGGGWFWQRPTEPGVYHRDAAEEAKAPGMTVFQSGILLGGWKEYHRVTHDPEVEPAMKAAAGLLFRSWKLNDGWPYIITPEGKGHPNKPFISSATNIYSADGFLYVGLELLEDPAYQEVALEAFDRQLKEHEIVAIGQRIGYTLRGGNNLLGQLPPVKPAALPESP